MEGETSIQAALIFEVLGKPPEHLTETLQSLIKKVGEEKGIKVTSSKIHDPKEIEENKGFFTTFSEVEVEVENVINLIVVMFKYMPSHIEILYPEKIQITNQTLSDFMSGIIGRLHQYDEVARVLQNEKTILESKLKDILGKKEEAEKDSEI